MRHKVKKEDTTGTPRKCQQCRWRITFDKSGLCAKCKTSDAEYRDFGPI